MSTLTIQRQYDDVIAAHYDEDPQDVIGDSLANAVTQLRKHDCFVDNGESLRVLDVGVGTGAFLARLKSVSARHIVPFGLDLSVKMVEAARKKVPELVAAVDDAANLNNHFAGQEFDLLCTHFITGFVPMQVLAPKIWDRLSDGGYWSFVGGTTAGFPGLQAKAAAAPMRWWFGGGKPLSVDSVVCNPSGRDDVVAVLESNGFAVRECETFEPRLRFKNFDDFMDFGYRGGWLTPFLEALGVHKAGFLTRLALNAFFFPVEDHHSIEIVLAQKVGK